MSPCFVITLALLARANPIEYSRAKHIELGHHLLEITYKKVIFPLKGTFHQYMIFLLST